MKTTLKLRGMSCASCANNIEAAIRSVPGVTACTVNFGTEQATVTFDAKRADLQAIQTAVDEAGYVASPIEHDTLTEDSDEEKAARQAETQDLTRKVWVGGVISTILLVGSLPVMLGLS